METLAYVGGSRWRIAPTRSSRRSVRDPHLGWLASPALCLLGGAFLLSLQQAWGEKDAPDHEAAGLPGCGKCCPGSSGQLSCCGGWRAEYDGKTKLGPWAYMCASHFSELGKGLGTGRGQRLVVVEE